MADRLLPDSDWNALLEWLMLKRGYDYPRQLARALGVSRQAMARWMAGENAPVPAMCRYLTLELLTALGDERQEWGDLDDVPSVVREQFARSGVALA